MNKTASIDHFRPRWRIATLITASLTTALNPCLQAHVTSNRDCVTCHSAVQNRFELAGFQDMSSGSRVYKVAPGASVPIGITVTNGSTRYAANLYVADASGVTNASDTLGYQPDPTWTIRTSGGTHYMLPTSGTFSSTRESLVFNLTVNSETLPDLYRAVVQVAGTGGGRWAQKEQFLIQVVPPTLAQPQITSPVLSDGKFHCSVPTTSGATYFLEYKARLDDGNWTTLGTPLIGDGKLQTFTDLTPSDPARYYRVRVQP